MGNPSQYYIITSQGLRECPSCEMREWKKRGSLKKNLPVTHMIFKKAGIITKVMISMSA